MNLPSSCIRCGSTDFESGILRDGYFFTDRKLVRDFFGLIPIGQSIALLAVACRNCGHVELIVDTEKIPKPNEV